MTPHEILSILELGGYLILFQPITFLALFFLCLTRGQKQVAWLYLNAFATAKIVGPAIAIYLDNKKSAQSNVNLQMASQIINQIALGPLLSATLSFANHQVSSYSQRKNERVPMHPVEAGNVPGSGYSYAPFYYPLSSSRQNSNSGKDRIFGVLLHLLHPMVMVGLVLGIIGGVDRAPDSSTDQIDLSKWKHGITMSKISSVLFLLATLSLFAVVAVRFITQRRRQGVTSAGFSAASTVVVSDAALLFVVIPLLLVRVLYTFMYSFDLNKNDPSATSKFDQQNGSWVIYLFLGFIPQITVLAAFTVLGLVSWRNERARVAA